MGDSTRRLKIWAILPVKPFNLAKSRLSEALSPAERQSLAENLYRHTLETLLKVPQLAGILVVSRDSKAISIARDHNVTSLQESRTPELNAILNDARAILYQQGAQGVMIIPADMPFLTVEAIAEVIDAAHYTNTVVIVPDHAHNGTNCLLIAPPEAIVLHYGPDSFAAHVRSAKEAGLTAYVREIPEMALDLDTPDDLATYRAPTFTSS